MKTGFNNNIVFLSGSIQNYLWFVMPQIQNLKHYSYWYMYHEKRIDNKAPKYHKTLINEYQCPMLIQTRTKGMTPRRKRA